MIYGLVWTADDDVVKIGYTTSPQDPPSIESVSGRMSNMQTGHWREMVCIAMAPGGHSKETFWHHEFSHYRVRGEWFLRHGEVAEWCNEYAIEPMPFTEIRTRRLREHIDRASKRTPLHALERRREKEAARSRGRVVKLTDPDHPFRHTLGCKWPKPCECATCASRAEARDLELNEWLKSSVGA